MAEPIKTEEWKTIKDFPDYAVSNYGKVKRIRRARTSKIGRKLKPQLQKGYLKVFLYRFQGKSQWKQIHHLVLEAFINPRPIEKQCNHKDGNPLNNYVNNLEWVTISENRYHSFNVLGHKALNGEQCSWSKLTNKNVKKIRKLYATGQYRQHQLAKQFNIHQSSISRIVCNLRWHQKLHPNKRAFPSSSNSPHKIPGYCQMRCCLSA